MCASFIIKKKKKKKLVLVVNTMCDVSIIRAKKMCIIMKCYDLGTDRSTNDG